MALTEWVMMPGQDYKSICDSVRAKTGKTNLLKSGEVAPAIDGIVINGGIDTSTNTPATSNDILKDKVAFANGIKLTGTIVTNTANNIATNKATITVPAGYYASSVTKTIATVAQAVPSVSINSTGLVTATSIQSAGYVDAGQKTEQLQLTTQTAQTITPNTRDQVISSGTYLTGNQTIKGDANLISENIKNGVSIFGVTGTLTASSGTSQGKYCWKKYAVVNDYEIITEDLGSTKPSDAGATRYPSYTITNDGYFQLESGSFVMSGYLLPTGATNGKTKTIYYEQWHYSTSESIYTYMKLTISNAPASTLSELYGYVVSDNADAYPTNGTGSDGYWYTLLTEN